VKSCETFVPYCHTAASQTRRPRLGSSPRKSLACLSSLTCHYTHTHTHTRVTSWSSSVRGSSPGRGKEGISSSSTPRPDRRWGTSRLLTNGCEGSFPRSKAAGARSWPQTPSSAGVNNVWSYTSIPQTYLHGVWRTNQAMNTFSLVKHTNKLPFLNVP
jgi:hypothetical protein